jgi:CheY-like chemotaxis protein
MIPAETWYEIVLPPLVTLIVIDLEFSEHRIAEAYEKQRLGKPSESDRVAIRDAVEHLAPLVAQSRILWVDNQPGGNHLERSTLLSWEVDVQAARDTEEALRELKDDRQRFDLVISDWRRPGDSPGDPAGPKLAREIAELELEPGLGLSSTTEPSTNRSSRAAGLLPMK